MPYALGGKHPALEPGSTVLVTGVTGLIGGHVADKLLENGYKVRGITRNASKGQWTVDCFTKKYGPGNFELVEVKDLTNENVLTDVLKGASGVAHVASDLSWSPDPNEVITPTLGFIRTILAAAATTPSVKRFVYTSSSTALTAAKPGQKVKITLDSWNDEDIEKAWAPPPYKPERGLSVYSASKAQGEKEAWNFLKEHKPGFVLNAVNPNVNFGRLLHKSQNSSTSAWPMIIYNTGKVDDVIGVPPQWCVDVEDTALLHVAALIDPDVQNERVLAFGEPFNWNKVLAILKKLSPGRKFQSPIENEQEDLMEIPNEKAAELLKKFGQHGFTPLEQVLKKRIDFDEANNS